MKAMNIVKTAVWLAFLAGISVAGVKRVFVADVGISAGASAKITPEEITLVTKSLRGEAVKNLPPGEYEIMTKETVIAQGGAAPNICDSVECVISLGSAIGADFIARGTINKIRTMFALTVEIHETENGNLVASSELVRSENIVELIEKGAKACADMYRMFAGGRSPTQKAPTTYTITATANPNNGGYVSRSPNQTYYAPGTDVSVTATPASGYKFTGWSGASTSTKATLTGPIDRDLTLTANFQYIGRTYTLTTKVFPSDGGVVTRYFPKETYEAGEEVILIATAHSGYTFAGWTGAVVSGFTHRLTVIMDGDMTLTANFYKQSVPASTPLVQYRPYGAQETDAGQTVGTESGGEKNARFYFAPKYQLPVGAPTSWGGVNMEIGCVWRNGVLFGIDGGLGYEFDYRNVLGGVGLSLGKEFDLGNQMQLVIGGSAGLWYVGKFEEYQSYYNGRYYEHYERNTSDNFLAPFVKWRWRSFEIMYRGLLGINYKNDWGYRDGKYYDDYDDGFGYNSHQLMAGYYLATKSGGGDDFSVGRRFGTWALNLAPFLVYPSGAGSFFLMKDYAGGGIILGSTAVGFGFLILGDKDYAALVTGGAFVVGSHIFNFVRSATYHKPKSKMAAANFKLYDGLKFAIVPTESGDFKALTRYDYTF